MKIDLVNTTTQDDDKLVEVKTYSYVVVWTTKISSEDPMINQATFVTKGNHILQVNQEIDTNKVRVNQITRTPYLHPNHKRKHLNQSAYLYHFEHKQQIYVPRKNDVNTI